MSVVRINAITVPPERADELVDRFARRAGEVASMPGFEAFELLRPSDDRDVFLVYTRWESSEAFDAWLNSAAFRHGHAQYAAATATGSRPGHGAHGHADHESGADPVSTRAELWSFDVVQDEVATRRD